MNMESNSGPHEIDGDSQMTGSMEERAGSFQSFHSSDSFENGSATINERAQGEPGIIVSENKSELGPLLTLLTSVFWCQKALNRDIDDLNWHENWWNPHSGIKPQSVLHELVRLCAFLHMPYGRTQTDSYLLEQAIGQVSDLDEFFQKLEPIASTYTLKIDGEPVTHLKLDECSGDVCAELDNLFLGKDVELPPVIIANVEAYHSLTLSPYWYPQRKTNQLSALNSKVALTANDLNQQLSDIRRKRLDLRSFKGTDVLEMLNMACLVMKERGSDKTVDALKSLGEKLGNERNHLMDMQEDLSEKTSKIKRAYDRMDPEIFTLVDMELLDIKRYNLVGLMVDQSNYFLMYDGQWFDVHEGQPTACSLQTVLESAGDTQNLLAIYTADPDVDQLTQSRSIKEFCDQEINALYYSDDSISDNSDSDEESEGADESHSSSEGYHNKESKSGQHHEQGDLIEI